MKRLPWLIVEEYSNIVSRYGPDSAEALQVRQKYETLEGFNDFAQEIDALKRSGSSLGSLLRFAEPIVQKISCNQTERVETGAVEFTYADGRIDWKGLFLRGDHAAFYAMNLAQAIEQLKQNPENFLLVNVLQGLVDTINGDVIS